MDVVLVLNSLDSTISIAITHSAETETELSCTHGLQLNKGSTRYDTIR